ncbi:MAG TPA: hypothetical protein VFS09_03240 [Candidatus Eisenbacteria bacterium]|nr:hypothetical protein [Candidatus Eisenbacteria bacterium]
MKVTRNVVNDLLPLYQAGEASADSRALVEEFLRANPEFQREMLERAALSESLQAQPFPSPGSNLERSALERTRHFVRARTIMLSLAIACWLIPFSFAFDGHGLRWILWRDNPRLAIFFIGASALFSAAHTFLGWRLRRGKPRR